MKKSNTWFCVAVGVAVVSLSPSSAMASTRAGDSHKIVYSSAQAAPRASDRQGPKGGFPKSPGLDIAKIKADDHAAFKRHASNGC